MGRHQRTLSHAQPSRGPSARGRDVEPGGVRSEVAGVIGLLPSSVRLDGYAPWPGPEATFVRLEYGDGDADWLRAEAAQRPFRSKSRAERPRGGSDRSRGIVAYLASLFEWARASEDTPVAEPTPSVDGADAPSPAR